MEVRARPAHASEGCGVWCLLQVRASVGACACVLFELGASASHCPRFSPVALPWNRQNVRWNDNRGLLGDAEDVDVGKQQAGLAECPSAYKNLMVSGLFVRSVAVSPPRSGQLDHAGGCRGRRAVVAASGGDQRGAPLGLLCWTTQDSASACCRSAIKSSASSRPIESRNSPGGD